MAECAGFIYFGDYNCTWTEEYIMGAWGYLNQFMERAPYSKRRNEIKLFVRYIVNSNYDAFLSEK